MYGLLLVLLTALVAACNRSQAEGPGRQRAETPAAPPAIAITAGRAEGRTVARTVETTGSLLAWEEVVVKAEQPGTLARLRADLGDRVRAGQVLADYDRREFELAVEQARAQVAAAQAQLRRQRDALAALEAEVARAQSQYEWARSELERARQLSARELIAARDVDNARNAFNVASAQLAAARVALAQHPDQVRAAEAELRRAEAALGIADKRLADTTVRAPMDGVVARRHVSAGEFVREGTALFTLVTLDPLKYVGTVPERYAPLVRVGQPVRLGVEAHPGREFEGTVTRVAPVVEVQTRTLALEARVPNPTGALRPGFFARGTVLVEPRAPAVFVPADAVAYVAGLTKVFVVTGPTVQERLVRLGERQGTWVEVLTGIQAGETVATANLAALYDGAPVTLRPTPER
jgi:multidrug resistance efflux pump